jgi:hypothetical protein
MIPNAILPLMPVKTSDRKLLRKQNSSRKDDKEEIKRKEEMKERKKGTRHGVINERIQKKNLTSVPSSDDDRTGL